MAILCHQRITRDRGRGLHASQALAAGKIVFYETPAAVALARDYPTREEEDREMVTQILCPQRTKEVRDAIAALVGENHWEGFLDEAVAAVVPVRREVRSLSHACVCWTCACLPLLHYLGKGVGARQKRWLAKPKLEHAYKHDLRLQ